MKKIFLYIQYIIGIGILAGVYTVLLDRGLTEQVSDNLLISGLLFILESFVMTLTNPVFYGLVGTIMIYKRLKEQKDILLVRIVFLLVMYPVVFTRMRLDSYVPAIEYNYYLLEFILLQGVFQGLWLGMTLMKRKNS